jgi:2-oxoglutarate dehydrogenase E1 component
VHASWSAYFTNQDAGYQSADSFATVGAAEAGKLHSNTPRHHHVDVHNSDTMKLFHLVRAYQESGHENANLDPLGIHKFRNGTPPTLDYTYYGFKESDLDRKMEIVGANAGGTVGFLTDLAAVKKVTLRAVLEKLKGTYCNGLGVEYMHINSRERCNWIRNQVENPKFLKYTKKKTLHIFERLCFADRFEKFLANKFNTAKRFGLEGAESFIPGLKCMVDRGSELGVETFGVGMPHRGRLNVLTNVLRKPMPLMFKEFEGTHYDLDDVHVDGYSYSSDVKYHLGTGMDRVYPDGRQVHLFLVANPSHLEAVDPVVLGKIRAKQYLSGDSEEAKKKHLPIIVHGDAAMAGQGIVYETMQMAKVPDFDVGGTIHVIVNNQVGFTTDPEQARSTMYCSDIGKTFDCPIFHCNGDEPLSVTTAFEMAVEWRQKYGQDCVIDIVCYRRLGHNELDQPFFTQPAMYNKIKNHPDAVEVFEAKIVEDKIATAEELLQIKQSVETLIENEYVASKTFPNPKDSDWLTTKWAGFKSPRQLSRIQTTGVDATVLGELGTKLASYPDSFSPHKQIAKIIGARKNAIEKGAGIDWGTAEALAFASLLKEGNHVRLTGQDVERGTFSHRHAKITDQLTGEKFCSLNTVSEDQAKIIVRNSILSEFAVLGFEHGYSLENPNSLILWEAQFGDFVNGAQVMIDQFISSGEDKWHRQCGMVMLLPHGYDGQGAEHSSCRVERFLQSMDDDEDVIPDDMDEDNRHQIQHHNLQVVNCTTPANYFHVLRRQVHRQFRKPLVVVAPKALLRDKRCTSTLSEFDVSTKFQRVLGDTHKELAANPESARRVIFCSGKVYYDLVDERAKQDISDVAIVRLEQIAPFPFDRMQEKIAMYPNAEVMWCQEEPKNMGCWSYVAPRITTCFKATRGVEKKPIYSGRVSSASPATGLGGKKHNAELRGFLDSAFALN